MEKCPLAAERIWQYDADGCGRKEVVKTVEKCLHAGGGHVQSCM